MAAPQGGMRHFGQAASGDALNTPGSVRRLAQVAIPFQVGPYFVTSAADPILLREYAASLGREVAVGEHQLLARLGTDGGYEICADAEGAVRAVLLDYDEQARFVNSSPEAFAQSLQELDQVLRIILSTDQPRVAADTFARAEQRLRELDAEALTDRENWWPLVLDDIRDTAGADWYAAFEYVDTSGQKQIVTQSGGICLHPEERLWSTLRASGVEPGQVLRIHTELEPCFIPGHYCSLWMAQTFPEAEFTHNFPYGETAASRAQGIRQLREAAARPPRQ